MENLWVCYKVNPKQSARKSQNLFAQIIIIKL